MRMFLIVVLATLATGCERRQETVPATAAPPATGMSGFAAATAALSAGCEGGGFLQARLRGAVDADLDWRGAAMHCEGGPRPEGRGFRVALAGPMPAADPKLSLRFIFGIADRDVASGVAQALPTNVTVILEGDGRMFATRGDGHCAAELLQREPLPSTHRERVHVRGYCMDPAASLNSDERLYIPTFEFSGVVDAGEQP